MLTEHICAYENGPRAKEALQLLKTEIPLSKEEHSMARNYIMFRLTVSNACRAGAIINLTIKQINDAILQDGNYVVKVLIFLFNFLKM